jgi:hypothetical protein
MLRMWFPGWKWIGNGVRVLMKLRQKLELGWSWIPEVGSFAEGEVLIPEASGVGCVVLPWCCRWCGVEICHFLKVPEVPPKCFTNCRRLEKSPRMLGCTALYLPMLMASWCWCWFRDEAADGNCPRPDQSCFDSSLKRLAWVAKAAASKVLVV